MAKRSKKRSSSAMRVIEKSLTDAQRVLAGYISSGSDQVTDTIASVRRIFDNRQLAAALKKARDAQMTVAGAIGGRGAKGAKKRKARGNARRKSKTRRSSARKAVTARTGKRRSTKARKSSRRGRR